MTRIDRRLFSIAITTKRQLGELLHSNDRLHDLIESYYNVLDYQDITQHELMLADGPRIDSYRQGIKDHVGPQTTLIDLGTGTGILAMFAAQQHQARVYALDHCDVIDMAEQLAKANGLADRIEFVRRKSTEFTPPQRVDMILHEQIGNAVFNEQMFRNMIDLRKRALKPGGRVLPNPIMMYAEPVTLKSDYRVPFIWQQNLYGIDYSCLTRTRKGRKTQRLVPMYAHHYDELLTAPEPLFVADFETIDFDDLPTRLTASRTITKAGILDGFCLYFDAVFDANNVLSNSPRAPAHVVADPVVVDRESRG